MKISLREALSDNQLSRRQLLSMTPEELYDAFEYDEEMYSKNGNMIWMVIFVFFAAAIGILMMFKSFAAMVPFIMFGSFLMIFSHSFTWIPSGDFYNHKYKTSLLSKNIYYGDADPVMSFLRHCREHVSYYDKLGIDIEKLMNCLLNHGKYGKNGMGHFRRAAGLAMLSTIPLELAIDDSKTRLTDEQVEELASRLSLVDYYHQALDEFNKAKTAIEDDTRKSVDDLIDLANSAHEERIEKEVNMMSHEELKRLSNLISKVSDKSEELRSMTLEH